MSPKCGTGAALAIQPGRVGPRTTAWRGKETAAATSKHMSKTVLSAGDGCFRISQRYFNQRSNLGAIQKAQSLKDPFQSVAAKTADWEGTAYRAVGTEYAKQAGPFRGRDETLWRQMVFGDHYYSPSATITNPHCNAVKTLCLGGPGKRSEPERRDWSRSDQSRSGGERSFPGPPRRPHTIPPATVQVLVQLWP